MEQLMKTENLPYNSRSMTYNSRLAQELGVWADTQNRGFLIHDKIYKAYFVENKNIGQVNILMDIVRQTVLNETTAREILEERTYKKAVDDHWEQAHKAGVTGVPTYVAGGRGVVGAQAYEILAELVEQARASKMGS